MKTIKSRVTKKLPTIILTLLAASYFVNVNAQVKDLNLAETSSSTILESSNNSNTGSIKVKKMPNFVLSNISEKEFSSNQIILTRVYNTPDIFVANVKTPMFKYKKIINGKVYIVLDESTSIDPQTGYLKKTNTRSYKRISWCELQPCLLSSAFWIRTCEVAGNKMCEAGYDSVEIDFSKIRKLQMGESEQFVLESRQVKVGKNRIDFQMNNRVDPATGKMQTMENYLSEYTNTVFGKDKIVVLPEAERQRREDLRNKRFAKKDEEVNSQDILDITQAAALEEPTEYLDVLVTSGDAGSALINEYSTDNVSKNRISSSSTDANVQITEICMDELNHVKKSEIVTLTSNSSNPSVITRSDSNAYVTSIVESSESPMEREVDENISSDGCKIRRNLLINESIAGSRGALTRPSLENDVKVNIENK